MTLCRYHMTSSLVIVFLSLLYASATSYASKTTSVDCQLAGVYQHANASAQFNVSPVTPANPIKVEVLNTSETDHWRETNAPSVSSKACSPNSNPLLESAFYLDVSSTLHSPSDVKADLSGCTHTFSLPASHLAKTDDGSCRSVFDDACLNNLISDAVDSTRRVILEGDITMAGAQLVCSSPSVIQASSRPPPKTKANDAESVFGATDIWRIVVSGMLVNACVFWLL